MRGTKARRREEWEIESVKKSMGIKPLCIRSNSLKLYYFNETHARITRWYGPISSSPFVPLNGWLYHMSLVFYTDAKIVILDVKTIFYFYSIFVIMLLLSLSRIIKSPRLYHYNEKKYNSKLWHFSVHNYHYYFYHILFRLISSVSWVVQWKSLIIIVVSFVIFTTIIIIIMNIFIVIIVIIFFTIIIIRCHSFVPTTCSIFVASTLSITTMVTIVIIICP